MLQSMCLLLVVSAVSPLKTPLHGVHDAKYEALRDFARKEITGPFADILVNIILDQGTVIKDMENKINSLIDQASAIRDLEKKVNTIVDKGSTTKALESKILEQGISLNVLEKKVKSSLDQGKTINALEEKVNTLSELVDKQEGQIMMMQGQISDLESVVQKQNQDFAYLRHEKEVFNETIIAQSKMDKHMKWIIGTYKKEEGKTHNDKQNDQKRTANRHAIRTKIIPSHMVLSGIMKNYKHSSNTATKWMSNTDLVENENKDKMPNQAVKTKTGHYTSVHGSGRDSVTKRTATHVAFSTYLSHTLEHLSIGHVIKLDKVFLNDGNGYNKITGIFTAPVTGVYLLTYSIENAHKTHHLEIELRVDNNHMGTLKAYAYGQVTSKTIIARLTAGQSVWLESAYYPDASISASGWNKFTTFSGVLLY